MTFGENRGSFYTGSIVRVTGWAGAHGDEPPSIGPATTPDAKHIDGQPARCFDVFEGEIMGADLQTKNSIVTRMTAPLELRFAASKGTSKAMPAPSADHPTLMATSSKRARSAAPSRIIFARGPCPQCYGRTISPGR